jgi:DNA-binding NarL/FixJ family response regulator
LIKRARIVLADDHGLIMAGTRALLDNQYEVVGQFGDGQSLVAGALRLRPDLTILDISMPAMNGVDAARQIRKEWPDAKLLFVSMHSSPVYLREAMDAGGAGYVIKSAANEELRLAVEKVLKGQVYISSAFDQEVVESVQASMKGRSGPSLSLTFRQTEVLQLIAEGSGNKEIANLLNISVKTVEFHRGRIMAKLGANNAADLIRYAFQAGMVGA